MESINFHLLRHLVWQAKNLRPLFTASAAMFESANRLLIAPLTGTVNQCQLLVRRFVRAKIIAKTTVEDDCLTELLTTFNEKKKLDECYGFVENTKTRKFRSENPNLKLFCRKIGNFFLSSAAYGRGCVADKFVCVSIDDDLSGDEYFVGKILFFFRGDVERCVLRKLRVVKKLKLVTMQEQKFVPFGFVVEDTEEKMEIVLTAIKYKLFYFKFNEVSYLITMLSHFEHN